MRVLGALLAAFGLVIAGYYGLLFDERKSVGGSLGGASIEIKVKDDERSRTRQTGLMLGFGFLIGGGLVMAFSGKRR